MKKTLPAVHPTQRTAMRASRLNRLALMAPLLVSGLMLQACATTGASSKKVSVAPPITPTEQFALTALSRDETVHIKIHPTGFSDNQRRALDQIAAKASWDGGGPVDVSILTAGSPEAVRAGYAIKDYLVAHKVSANVISYGTLKDHPGDIASITLSEYRAEVPECGKDWENLSATRNNTPHSNFGCALTANLAAQIDDPRDIAAPQKATPADAGRKVTIIDKYRKGEITSSEENDAAKGTVSTAVQ